MQCMHGLRCNYRSRLMRNIDIASILAWNGLVVAVVQRLLSVVPVVQSAVCGESVHSQSPSRPAYRLSPCSLVLPIYSVL